MIAKVITSSYRLIIKHWKPLLLVAIATSVLSQAAVFIEGRFDTRDPSLQGLLAFLSMMAMSGLALSVSHGFSVVLAQADKDSAIVRYKDIFEHLFTRLAIVFLAYLASIFLIALGTLALVIPGIIIALSLAVVIQVALIEPVTTVRQVLRTSRNLTRGYRRRILGVFLLVEAPFLMPLPLLTYAGNRLGDVKLLFEAVKYSLGAAGGLIGSVVMAFTYFWLVERYAADRTRITNDHPDSSQSDDLFPSA